MLNDNLLVLIPFLPLLGAIISGFIALAYSKKEHGPNKGLISFISCMAPLLSCLLAVMFFFKLQALPEDARMISYKAFEWIRSGNLVINFDFLLDPLSAVMILVVTFIGTLIHIYSIGYMSHDRGFARYFAYLNLFTFSMLVLVLSKNLVFMFLGWEGVGLCSYLLIGFWFGDKEKAVAGNKAFITNRIGDFAFLLGIFLLFWSLQEHTNMSLDFVGIRENINYLTPGIITAITLLLFIGATGKSAQIPLHVWLPDAMAGPTPVSALIHAATMVTAGIYMIARLNFMYSLAHDTLFIIACIGVATAFFAATVAVTQDDIKKVLAYSTVSQLGFMFLALGVGAYGAAVFHVFTHAFFKALLFLGSGSVIHAMSEEQNIWKMGGLFKKMKITGFTFLIGTLAIAGIPPFSGFFSKDEILWKTWEAGHMPFYFIALITAGITAFYMARLFILVFMGEIRNKDTHVVSHIHESPAVMTLPLIILAIGSAVVGFLGIPHASIMEHWLEPVFAPVAYGLVPETMVTHAAEHAGLGAMEITLMAVSVAVALLGIFTAFVLYVWNKNMRTVISEKAPIRGIDNFLNNKWYFDEIYRTVIINPLVKISDYFLYRFMDKAVIDGLVNGTSKFYEAFSYGLRDIQTGKVRHYAYLMMFGILFIFIYATFSA